MTPEYSRAQLIDQVSEASARWYERSGRRSNSAQGTADGVVVTENGHDLSFSWRMRERAGSANPAVGVRQRLHTRDSNFEGNFELEVVFVLRDEFPIGSSPAVRAFLEEVAFEYVFGMIRTAHFDMARAMGSSAGLIPAFDVRALIEQSVDGSKSS